MKNESDFSWEYQQVREEILKIIDLVLYSGRYINGPELAKFEEEFAEYVGKKFCVGVGNGYDALYLAYKIIGLDRGRKVGIMNELHISTTNAAQACGATVQKVYDFSAKGLDALVVVHNPNNADLVPTIPAPVSTYVIEDACRVIGSDCKIGCGIMQCWSFHPLKVLHCFGDGGAITTDDIGIYHQLKEMRDHGRIAKGPFYGWGVNSRLDEIHAAVLRFFLKRLPKRSYHE